MTPAIDLLKKQKIAFTCILMITVRIINIKIEE
ncbi:hypothetical protein BVZ50_00413 [Haemophilus influenzae]|nr:hypothetical protein BV041_01011 [Haemophilus influenzae]PRJ15720.1 hypothetical protein BV050_00159 [Haemophilus influenzae]PRK20684.1 hypothetical protein BV201_00644 [Haemophilus influenzae]PRM57634.1 hypothetical protein BVZ65_00150 [Haemophilus influenzae]PRM64365.1 hypothetical protein BVZ50_00413 [Haemophilus influenzae]